HLGALLTGLEVSDYGVRVESIVLALGGVRVLRQQYLDLAVSIGGAVEDDLALGVLYYHRYVGGRVALVKEGYGQPGALVEAVGAHALGLGVGGGDVVGVRTAEHEVVEVARH